ncbi:MAG: hypothetical protein GY798_00110 [Hyphomicrobiales bacterium]|nr:hypothetical protein [Hyphomicrobiales bacterium]
MSLKTDIAGWDEKPSDDIRRIYQRYSRRPSFGSNVVALLSDPLLQSGATWLLKHHLATGWSDISSADITAIYESLPAIEGWQARLHVLQSIRYLPIPESHASVVERFAQNAVFDTVKFVRAWGYDAWHQLAVQHPDYRQHVAHMLADALASETAASVKVRIRKALDAGFYLLFGAQSRGRPATVAARSISGIYRIAIHPPEAASAAAFSC